MKTWVRKTLSVGVLAAGALLFAPGAAQADLDQLSADNSGVLNGTQLAVPVNIPISVAGVGLGILGDGTGSGSAMSGHSTEAADVSQFSGEHDGALNGTQAYVPVSVPITLAGIGVGVAGDGTGTGAAMTESGHAAGGVTQASGEHDGLLNGTQAYAPINIPITLAGIGVGVAGDGTGTGAAKTESGHAAGGATQASGGHDGLLNGTQLFAPINVPVNVAGIGLGVAGDGTGTGSASTGSSNSSENGGSQASGDIDGVGNGTQVQAPVNAPINVCGLGLGVLGDGTGECGGNGGNSGGENPGGGYGDNNGRKARHNAEALPTDGLTRGLPLDATKGTDALNLGGLGALSALR